MTETNSVPPELGRSSILKGKKALIVGVANDRSIAWGCAEAMHRSGAEIAMTYLNDKARPYVEPLASAVEASLLMPLEVREPAQVDSLFEAIAAKWGRLDILVHSIAFAPRQALEGRVTDCPRDGFLTAMDVSCWSLLDLMQGSYLLQSETRKLDDIRKIGGNSPEDDLAFATAARVSEVTQGMYSALMRPAVRAMVTETSAEPHAAQSSEPPSLRDVCR